MIGLGNRGFLNPCGVGLQAHPQKSSYRVSQTNPKHLLLLRKQLEPQKNSIKATPSLVGDTSAAHLHHPHNARRPKRHPRPDSDGDGVGTSHTQLQENHVIHLVLQFVTELPSPGDLYKSQTDLQVRSLSVGLSSRMFTVGVSKLGSLGDSHKVTGAPGFAPLEAPKSSAFWTRAELATLPLPHQRLSVTPLPAGRAWPLAALGGPRWTPASDHLTTARITIDGTHLMYSDIISKFANLTSLTQLRCAVL